MQGGTSIILRGRETAEPHGAWIAADQFRGGVRVLITGPQGFEQIVTFALDEEPDVITQGIRQTLED
jgi:hypothetical protein